MVGIEEYRARREVAWCPGCGNFPILDSLKQAWVNLGLRPHEILVVSGIGQAGKLPQYTMVNTFHVLHGRTLPVATGAKLANNRLIVMAVGGDGDGYAEGGNHLIHAARRNVDITYLVHNNQVYGLTKGQASPTTDLGTRTTTTPRGNPVRGLNPIALALGLRVNFVARGYAGNKTQLVSILEEAIRHPGFSFVDILQPCVTFNKVNTYQWFAQRVYDLNAQGHDPADLIAAFERAQEWGDQIPTGVFYRGTAPAFHEVLLGAGDQALVDKRPDPLRIKPILEAYF